MPTRRLYPRAALGALVLVATLLFAGGTAGAEPSVAEIEREIDAAWLRLEPIIEKHNATRIELAKNRKVAEALGKRIAPLQLEVDLAMARVGQLAVRSYKGGNTAAFGALLSSGSPTEFAEQLAVLDHFARQQQHQVQDVVDLRARLGRQKAPLDQLVAQLSKTEAELATKKKQIDAEIKRLQALRLQAYGTTGGLGELRPAPCPYTYPGGAAGIAIKFACAQIGKPYVWGADGPGSYDCSGLTMAAWAQAGVWLPHNAAAQRSRVPSVSRANLRPGDLVFYYSDLHHVAMYAGNGWIVHASQSGVPIKMRRIDGAPIHSYGRPG